MAILQGLEKVKKETDKSQEMMEHGVDEYEKTHSVCCDYPLINGMCTSCKEGSGSQYEWDKEH